MLKHCLLLLLAASLIAIAAPFAAAQSNNDSNTAQPPAAQGQDHGAWRHGPQDPAGRTAELTRKLNLTPDQQTKVQDLFTAEHTQMEAVHQGSDQSDRRSKMMDIRKSTDTQVRAHDVHDARSTAQCGRRVIGRHTPATAQFHDATVRHADPLLEAEDRSRRRVAEREDQRRAHDEELLAQPGPTGREFVARRRPIGRGTALHDVGDEALRAR